MPRRRGGGGGSGGASPISVFFGSDGGFDFEACGGTVPRLLGGGGAKDGRVGVFRIEGGAEGGALRAKLCEIWGAEF